ncbi:MAG: NAD-dependent DNA ligase LigA [Proteobacteria bacterium]|nr:NAD-dependent DNA ligase LigA [Pseudomonadota bacterium]
MNPEIKKRWCFITLISARIVLLFLLISISLLPALSYACPEISNIDVKQQMTTLANDIRYHNQLYYEKVQPAISDAEYDRLFARLVQLEECFPALAAADSPTRTVGSGMGGGTLMVKHEQPMLSLSSSTGPEAVQVLFKKIATSGKVQLLVQPKIDGLPVELVYEIGRLVSASTRGNGRAGEDVTARVREIQGVPHRLAGTFPDRVVVRGEVYADRQLLQKYGQIAAAEKYATPRHMAAGVLKAQKPDPAAVAVLRLFPFELVTTGAMHSDLKALEQLSNWGFPVDLKQTHIVQTFADVQAVYRAFLANRDQQPFAMDGIVVKVDDLSLRRQLGEGGHAPFWAAAWKYPPDTARTQVLGIKWTVGRTGRRTPVAEVSPVRLGGILVTRVSLYNDTEIARLDIATGDQVLVELVGDVIPRVLEVVKRARRVTDSGAAATQMSEPVLDACLSDSPVCREQFLSRVTYFASKPGLGIKGLGRGRLQKLVEAGLVNDLPSLFLLKEEEVAEVPGFGMETARSLTVAIKAAGHAEPFRIVTALSVPGVGPGRVEHLSRQFTSLDALLTSGQKQLAALSSTDRLATKTIRRFFLSPGGQVLLVKFRKLGLL